MESRKMALKYETIRQDDHLNDGIEAVILRIVIPTGLTILVQEGDG